MKLPAPIKPKFETAVTKRKMLIKRLLICGSHAILMILLCWWWQTSSYTLEFEESLIQKSLVLKRKIFQPELDSTVPFLFIDISGTKKLVNREYKTGFEQITDRKKLADLFTALHPFPGEQYQYIICDVLFDKTTEDDTTLSNATQDLQRLIIPYTTNEEGIVPPVFNSVPSAYVGYDVSSGPYSTETLVKYPLISSPSLKSLPLIVYQNLGNKRATQAMGLCWIDGSAFVKDIIIDYRIRPENLLDSSGNNKIISLDEMVGLLLMNRSQFFHRLVENKIIVVGDFENDLHKTVLGNMPGPLILSNIYLSLQHGDGKVTGGILFYLFSSFLLLSGLLLYPPKWLQQFHKLCEETPLGFFLGELVLYALLVWLIAFICFLCTNFHINVVLQSLYITLFSTAKNYWEHARSRQAKLHPSEHAAV